MLRLREVRWHSSDHTLASNSRLWTQGRLHSEPCSGYFYQSTHDSKRRDACLQLACILHAAFILRLLLKYPSVASEALSPSFCGLFCPKRGQLGRPHLLLLSHSDVSDSLQPHGLQHARLPCPSLSPRVCSKSCPLSWWCCSTVSSSAPTFSFGLQSFPASGSFSMSWLFLSGGQSIGVSASASVLPMNVQGRFPLGLTDLISLQSKRLSGVFSNTTIRKQIFWHSAFFMVQLSHLYMTTGKNYSFDYTKLSEKWCLCFLINYLGLS